jgi:hypothetical protein
VTTDTEQPAGLLADTQRVAAELADGYLSRDSETTRQR